MCWGDRMQVKELRAEVETLTRERDSWRRVAERLQREVDSERDRRVAAQEAITLKWQPENADLARQLAEVKVSVHANVPGIGPDWVLLDRKTWERVFAATMSYCQGCADRDRQIETLTRQLAEAREALNLAAGYMRDRADPLPEHMAKVDAALSADRPAREEE